MIYEVTVQRWRCDNCHKGWSKKSRADLHAERCVKDPNNRGCGTCAHDDVDEDGYHCVIGVRPPGLICILNCAHWEPAS